MAFRVIISPVINPTPNAQTAKAEQYCNLGCVNYYALLPTGRVNVSWALTIGRATDWSLALADPQINFLFVIPENIDTRVDLRAFLSTNTIGDLTVPQQTALQELFDVQGINRTDFTLSTTGATVLRRVIDHLVARDMNPDIALDF